MKAPAPCIFQMMAGYFNGVAAVISGISDISIHEEESLKEKLDRS